MKKAERTFLIEDIDCKVVVEVVSKQKDIFDWMDEYIENFQYDFFDPQDDSFEIIYNDGTYEYVDEDFDGHKIRRNNIASAVYSNSCTYVVYGNFEINEYGVVTAAESEIIAKENIKEVA